MNDTPPPLNSLVLYKKRPARVLENRGRLEIAAEEDRSIKVRPKDITLLHPGPLHDLSQLHPLDGDVELAWQILVESGEPATLEELAALIYGEFTPQSAWAAWQLVEDGLYFRGAPDSIDAVLPEQVEKERRERHAKAEEAQAWKEFLGRARKDRVDPQEDARYLREVEDLALGRREESRVLRELGRSERPEIAHALLLEWGYWDVQVNPYPIRVGAPLQPPDLALPRLPEEERLDLTELPAYAIDDRENRDPDDALSLISLARDGEGNVIGGRLWVHVADPAALALPDSPLDLTARQRGATLYLPEGALPMLPHAAIDRLALGLEEVSPALSFEIALNQSAEPQLVRTLPSRVRVQRMSYEEVENRLEEEPFRGLLALTQAFEARRVTNGAFSIDLPEAIIRVHEGLVSIRPVERLASRDLVREAMLMAGEAAGRFALERGLPFPYASQDAPDFPNSLPEHLRPPLGLQTMSGRFAIRRFMKRSQLSTHPGIHAGLGLPLYSRLTSPLRRYLDLVAHQQLRLNQHGEPALSEQDLLQRLGASEDASLRVAQAESLSRRHWTLVYLLQHPGWEGEAILVDKNGLRGQVIIPDLAYEAYVHLRADQPLDGRLHLRLRDVNLPELEAHFRVQ